MKNKIPHPDEPGFGMTMSVFFVGREEAAMVPPTK
jgi:hypothetical protein